MSQPRRADFFGPVRVAMAGMVYTFKTQRHMRFHLYMVLVVMLLGLLFNLPFREMLVLLFVISLVLVAEMFNSAIEATVDLVQPSYHPMAKFAKDIAAGAVLITTIIALVVGGLMLLGESRWEEIKLGLSTDTLSVPLGARFGIGLLLVFIVVVIGKGLGKRGQVLKGGMVSGHSAFGFFVAVAIIFLSGQVLVSALAIFLASMIAQSRWEAKIHSIFEVSLGAAVGTILGLILFGLVPK